MTTFESLTLVCPICGITFHSTGVKSYSTGGKDTDFKPQFQGDSPLLNFVHSCTKCRFTSYGEGFKCSYDKDFIDFVKSNEYREKVCMSDILARNPYYRTAKLKEKLTSDKLILADLYLKAGWVAREEENDYEEATMQKLALDLFNKAIAEDDLKEDDQVTVLYLSGELSRRLGDLDSAGERMKAAHAHSVGVKKLAGIARLAEKQIRLIDEAMGQEDSVAMIQEDTDR